MKRVLILEKEWCEQEVLCRIIKKIADDTRIVWCKTTKEAMYTLEETEFDMFIISLEDSEEKSFVTEGLHFIRYIRQQREYFNVPVIFISNVSKYELYSYRHLHCYQYMKRPYDREYMEQLLSEILCVQNKFSKEPQMVFSFRGVIYHFPVREVIYVESLSRRLFVHTLYQTVEFPGMILKQFRKHMDPEIFLQCHRSYVVNRFYIRSFQKQEGMLGMARTNVKIPVGKTFKEEVIRKIKSLYH
ncbi:MAG: response regulator transcription factor [Lachnospiraceae bacterium]|nr:response regulator transcription factor [Lachnospiraceae bacterium]